MLSVSIKQLICKITKLNDIAIAIFCAYHDFCLKK